MPLETHDPQKLQEKWTAIWEQEGFFRSQPNPRKIPYSMVIPPPNVTGALHLGHALNGTIQDVMARFKRMQGFETLWLPGADHAGIATQAVVEKRIFEQEKKSRHDLGREELVRRIWAWKDEYEDRIRRQLRAMGASCDWSRWRFTLDATCARAVRTAFYRLFEQGYIYRGKRLVNWDVQLQTAVADDEVYHDEIMGHLWHFRYPVIGSDESLTIATTRPETMLGDTAVAVHPDDPRYQHLIGREVRLPLMDRAIPIIGDGQLVDRAFGTGVVKVTPAHDPNDYAAGVRNHLEFINILTPDGRINAHGGKYQGLSREQARKAVVADLEALGLVEKVEPHRHNVGHSDRSKTAIEPYLSDQWFVRMDELAERAMAAVRDGKVRIHPERYANTYLSWLGEKRDWCISRQLWWGHQIPVWSAPIADEAARASMTAALDRLRARFAPGWHARWDAHPEPAAGEPIATARVCLLADETDLVRELETHGFVRDPDVLDTWFSSGLWPFSTLGWPEATPELDYYFPTNLLSTAREIITLWVARMVLLAEFNLDNVPFHEVYIHPVIQDGHGMPMKKSLGNGVDPFDIIEKYGADALRYTLISMTTETQDVRLPVKKEKLPDGRTINTSEKFELGRNFATKIYNAARFLLGNLDGFQPAPLPPIGQLPLEDRWIAARLNQTIQKVTLSLDHFEYAATARDLYEFVWNHLCDWYLEIAKPRFKDPAARPLVQQVAAWILDGTLRLLHPILPFVTEEIWQSLDQIAPGRARCRPSPSLAGSAGEEALCIAAWPEAINAGSPADDASFTELQEVVRAVRNLRADFGINPREAVEILIDAAGGVAARLVEHRQRIETLANVGTFEVASGRPRPSRSVGQALPFCKVYLRLGDAIDLAAETAKQQKKRQEIARRRDAIGAKLANPEFARNAPSDVVEQQRGLAADLDRQLAAIDSLLADLST